MIRVCLENKGKKTRRKVNNWVRDNSISSLIIITAITVSIGEYGFYSTIIGIGILFLMILVYMFIFKIFFD